MNFLLFPFNIHAHILHNLIREFMYFGLLPFSLFSLSVSRGKTKNGKITKVIWRALIHTSFNACKLPNKTISKAHNSKFNIYLTFPLMPHTVCVFMCTDRDMLCCNTTSATTTTNTFGIKIQKETRQFLREESLILLHRFIFVANQIWHKLWLE